MIGIRLKFLEIFFSSQTNLSPSKNQKAALARGFLKLVFFLKISPISGAAF
jgi:hypothetical protein